MDQAALRAKYRQERDKRLRSDGVAQYIAVDGAFARFAEDPYANAGFSRAPIVEDVDVLIIGGGFGGLLTAARLQESSVDSLRIVEKAGDFGGAWYWNRYPGAACDVEAYIYLPLLEELGGFPPQKYAKGPEIFAHCQEIGRRFGLHERTAFQTEVTGLRWEETEARWRVFTNRGDAIRARFVCMSTGPLHKPRLPGVAGIGDFKGHAFHASRWDYTYTGGEAGGELVGLRDKTVGLIGTGPTGVQCVPHLGAWAKRLYVFQRTPSSVDVRNNRPTDAAWAETLEPGWQKRRMENFNRQVCGAPTEVDLVDDAWTDIYKRFARALAEATPEHAEELKQLADFEKMEAIRARVDAEVADPATAAALKPWYNALCKRRSFHDEYLQTFNRPNVTLVDTNGRGVERITERGVVAAGREHQLDCLIFATGFEWQTAYIRRVGYNVFGRGGMALSEKWRDGVTSLHGLHVAGFPNCFIVGNAQQGNTHNFTHMLDEMAWHVSYIVRYALDHRVTVEASPEAEQDWLQEVMSFANLRRQFDQECTPGNFNDEGQPSELTVRNNFYAGGPIAYLERTQAWKSAGNLPGMITTAAPETAP